MMRYMILEDLPGTYYIIDTLAGETVVASGFETRRAAIEHVRSLLVFVLPQSETQR